MKIEINSIIIRILTILLFVGISDSKIQSAETAAALLNKCATEISKAKSMDVSFKINGSNSGVLKTSGKKLMISVMGSGSWYDGKDMYTYNPSSNETTLYHPTKSELMEINPLYYISEVTSAYTASYIGNTNGISKTILLTPTAKRSQIKKIEVTVSSKSYLPEKMKIFPKSGNVTTFSITKITLNASLSSDIFKYPKNKYSKTKIIDLR